MSSTLSTSSTNAIFPIKLVWNSSVDAEKYYDVVDAEFKTKCILDGVNHVFNVTTANESVTDEPPLADMNRTFSPRES